MATHRWLTLLAAIVITALEVRLFADASPVAAQAAPVSAAAAPERAGVAPRWSLAGIRH